MIGLDERISQNASLNAAVCRRLSLVEMLLEQNNHAMRRCALVFAAQLLLVADGSRANAQKPSWRVDLRPYESQWLNTYEVSIKFAGRYLLVYAKAKDSASKQVSLVVNQETHQLIPKEEWSSWFLPAWEECPRTRFRKPFPEANIISCWKQMVIEQIGGIGLRHVGESEYYLHARGKERVLLLREPCNVDPQFAGDRQIVVGLCKGENLVVDEQGKKIYDLPRLSEPHIAPNRESTRFVVHECYGSIFQIEGADKRRVRVFRTSDGRKLFEYRWNLHGADGCEEGRAALSEDGSLVALLRGPEVLVFALPKSK